MYKKIIITSLSLLGIRTADMFSAAAAAAAMHAKSAALVGPAAAGAEALTAAAAFAGRFAKTALPRLELSLTAAETHAQTAQEQAKAFEQRCHELHTAATTKLVPLTVICKKVRIGFEWIRHDFGPWGMAKKMFMRQLELPGAYMAQARVEYNEGGAIIAATCAAKRGNEFIRAERKLRAAFNKISKEFWAIKSDSRGLTRAEKKLIGEIAAIMRTAESVLHDGGELKNYYSFLISPLA